MAKKKRHEEHVNHERWLVSYADFITLLFAFFVVMFAASNADEQKAGQVARSVQEGFSELALFDPSSSSFALFDEAGLPANAVTVVGPMSSGFGSEANLESIQNARKSLEKMLESEIQEGVVRFSMDERGLTISLAEAGFFATGSAAVRPEGLPVVDEIARKLRELPYDVRVEGHTDNVPINTPRFPSNWELSTSRATTVLQYLITSGEVPPSRLSAIGYGEYRPVAPNDAPAGRSLNRRVDIVVLNTAMDVLEPKSLAERSLEETGMPSVFLDAGGSSEEPQVVVTGGGPDSAPH